MQSRLSNIPGKPHYSPTWSNLVMSLTVGDLRYRSAKISTIARPKYFILSIVVDSPILKYSSVAYADRPYANIQNTVVILVKLIICIYQGHQFIVESRNHLFYCIYNLQEQILRHSISSLKYIITISWIIRKIIVE